jgi:hypothetical protein
MTDTSKVDTIELRCSENPRRMFAKLLHEGSGAPVVVPGNLLEFACRDCTKQEREEDHDVIRVLHRFNILGELVESEVIYVEMADNEGSGLGQPKAAT